MKLTLLPNPATKGLSGNNPFILESATILLTSGWPVMTWITRSHKVFMFCLIFCYDTLWHTSV